MSVSSSAKVVVQLPGGPVKGFVAEEDLAGSQTSTFDPKNLKVQLASTGEQQDVAVEDAKGIFFVKDFDGKTDHADLRFHDGSAPADYLWVRITFLDGEVLEGMIDNACQHVVAKGIWITPSDPTSNNWLIYASKAHLKNFQVLGLRQTLHRRVF